MAPNEHNSRHNFHVLHESLPRVYTLKFSSSIVMKVFGFYV